LKTPAGLATLLLAATVTSPALADGGYYTGALGARAAGRGGAFVARADDLTAVSINPAGLAELDGTVVELGNQFSHDGYDYTRAPTLDYGQSTTPTQPTAFDKVHNATPWQPALPFIGVSSRLGLRDWSFALAAFAPPGISREQFPQDGGQRYMMVNRQAIILDYTASAAWRFHDLWGVGVTLEWITVPRLDYSLVINGNTSPGAANPVSSPFDILAQTTGSDWFTFNAIVGAWFRPKPSLEFGLAGQILPANIVTHSTLTLSGLALNFDGTAVLGTITTGRGNGQESNVSVTLPLPLLVRGGGRYRHQSAGREVYDVELDVEYESWSRANAFTVATNGLVASSRGQPVPIGTITVPKQWSDVLSVKLGGDFNLIPDRWTLRAGVYYETAAAPAAYANVDFPAGAQMGAALGASLLMGRAELALTYQLRYQPSFSVAEADARVYQQTPASPCAAPYTNTNTCNANYLGQPSPAVNAGTYSATSQLVSLALIFRYGR
jgi:long-chain fatty acid transport protein